MPDILQKLVSESDPFSPLGFSDNVRVMTLAGSQYRVACTLYSKDGKRAAEVREFSNGETYLLESEWVEGTTFAKRNAGGLVGPFVSPIHAERFIVATPWFNGTE